MIADSAITKKCCRCKEHKSLDLFSPDTRKSFGRASRCKPCGAVIKRAYDEKCRNDPERMAHRRAQHNAWRKNDLEHQRARSRAKNAKRRDQNIEYLRKWRADNPEKFRALCKEYREKNAVALKARRQSESFKETRAEYWLKNPGMKAAIMAARRARQKAAMPAWADREAIAAIYRKAKTLTEQTGVEHHVDHIDPIQHRLVCGLHVAANLQILTADENRRKHNHFEPRQEVHV